VVKYLGVKISHDLQWNDHIDYVTAEANSTLGFVRRNININNPEVKERAYKTLVRPILEYSSIVWDPHTTTAVQKIESVQRRAVRTTLKGYRRTSGVGAMTTELNWQPLAERRRIARLVMFYKIHYQLVTITMPLELKFLLMPIKMENALAYVIPSSSCDYHMYSFYPRTVREWKNLAQDVVQLDTPETFRSALQSI